MAHTAKGQCFRQRIRILQYHFLPNKKVDNKDLYTYSFDGRGNLIAGKQINAVFPKWSQ